MRIASIDARSFGQDLREFLQQDDNLALLPGYGWLDGGCGLLAAALEKWIGQDLAHPLMLGTAAQPLHHVVVRCGRWYVDADGVSLRDELRQRWREVEHLRSPRLAPLDRDALYASEIPHDAAIRDQLVQRLDERYLVARVRVVLMQKLPS